MHRAGKMGILLGVMIGLVACGKPATSTPSPGNQITLPPISTRTIIIPGCDTKALESWYEVAVALQQAIQAESLAALELSPEQREFTLARLSDLSQALARQPAPECAALAHGTALLYIEQIEQAFQTYADGALDAQRLREQVTASVKALREDVGSLMVAAGARLTQALEDQRPTLSAGGAP